MIKRDGTVGMGLEIMELDLLNNPVDEIKKH